MARLTSAARGSRLAGAAVKDGPPSDNGGGGGVLAARLAWQARSAGVVAFLIWLISDKLEFIAVHRFRLDLRRPLLAPNVVVCEGSNHTMTSLTVVVQAKYANSRICFSSHNILTRLDASSQPTPYYYYSELNMYYRIQEWNQ